MYECKIAEKLVALRTAKGVTQEDVATSLSVSNKTISKWENGASAPDLTMLVHLANYYGVTTDALLGLEENKTVDVRETVRRELEGLGRKDAICKAFDMVKAVIPAYSIIPSAENDQSKAADAFPAHHSSYYRSQIVARDIFDFVASSDDVNIAVMLLRNSADFSWLKDPDKQQKIVKLFKFLSSEDALSVLYFTHCAACSNSFTADYISQNTGLSTQRVSEILDEFCTVGNCRSVTAQLAEGEVTVYECYGDGIILSALTLAYEQTCGKGHYEYSYYGACKMIGGA